MTEEKGQPGQLFCQNSTEGHLDFRQRACEVDSITIMNRGPCLGLKRIAVGDDAAPGIMGGSLETRP